MHIIDINSMIPQYSYLDVMPKKVSIDELYCNSDNDTFNNSIVKMSLYLELPRTMDRVQEASK